MKGDKGESYYGSLLDPRVEVTGINVVVEFAGTLLGFDDYVSMFYATLFSLHQLANQLIDW